MIIEFPFIERNQTANKKNKFGSNFVKTKQKNVLKNRCETIVYLAKKNNGIVKPFYGAFLNRYWMFKDNRQRDYDNFCSGTKYYTDALVSQGLIIDDNKNHLIYGRVWHFDKQPEEKIIYELRFFDTKEKFETFRGILDGLYRKQLGM